MEGSSLSRLDAIINRLLTQTYFSVPDADVAWLLSEVIPVLLREPSVLDLTGPLHVCGDIHGQFPDLIRILEAGGFTYDTRYLFLGDYVDRGDQSLEVICLLFAMKLRYQNNIFLLRGNHESPEMTESFGFYEECEIRLESDLYPEFLSAFCCLPIAAVVNGCVFCVHGGLSPLLTSIDEIRGIERPVEIPDEGLLADLLWSDPCRGSPEWGPNARGETFTWGLSAADKFMKDNGIVTILRAHQVAYNGYDYPFEPARNVVTIFSAPAYANRYNNAGAFVTIGGDSAMKFTVLPPIVEPTNDDDLPEIEGIPQQFSDELIN